VIGLHQGVDIVEIARLRDVMERHEAFATDVFTERERRYCESRRDPYRHFAGRFAAKESYLKALGVGLTGAGPGRSLRDIEVVTGASGKPGLSVSGWVAGLTKRRGIEQSTVSISHTAEYAVATVILVGQGHKG